MRYNRIVDYNDDIVIITVLRYYSESKLIFLVDISEQYFTVNILFCPSSIILCGYLTTFPNGR